MNWLRLLKFTVLLSLWVPPNCDAYLKFQDNFSILEDQWQNVSVCQNVPDKFKGKVYFASTDQCILLFSKNDCTGNVHHLFPGFNSNLVYFYYQTLSFRACSSHEIEFEYKEPDIIFYDGDNFSIPYEGPSGTCQNLNQRYIWAWGVGVGANVTSVTTKSCILLYSEENCKGEIFRVPEGYNHKLISFKDKTKSFKYCFTADLKQEYHIKFYSRSNYTSIAVDVKLQPGCNEKIYVFNNVQSIDFDTCAILFDDYGCSGNSYKFESGRHNMNITSFWSWRFSMIIGRKNIKSLRSCSLDYQAEPSQNHRKYDVRFSKTKKDSNDYPEYIKYERISTTCQNIHWSYVKTANSVETKKCILLYEKEDCEGIPYKVSPGNHPSLDDFNGKLVSFKACLKYDNEIEHHVKFYSSGNYTGLLDDIDVYQSCNRVDLRTSFNSMISHICLELYSDPFCSSGHSYEVQPGHHSLPSKNIQSLRPCNLIDDIRFQSKGKRLLTRPFKLKAKIINFHITSDEDTVKKLTKTSFGEMGQRTVFRNDGPAIQTQRYSTQKIVTDKIEMERVKGLSQMSEVSLSETATKDFTSGFRSSLNTGFKTSNTYGSSQSFTKETSSGVNNTIQGSANAKFNFGIFSVGGGGGGSHSTYEGSRHEKTSQSHQEHSREESVFKTEERNVEERIGSALTSGYRASEEQSSTLGTKFTKEETRTFTIDQTITVSACTEYDVSSFVKRTENFPVTYTAFALITGKYDDDGSDLTAEELEDALDELEFEGKMDDFAIVAKGSAFLTLDFSWYSVWQGKGSKIEGCDDATGTNPQISNSMAFSGGCNLKILFPLFSCIFWFVVAKVIHQLE